MEEEMLGLVGPPMAAGLPPNLRLLLLTDGKRISQVVHVLAQLGVADHLADGARSVEDLAEATGSHADALYRVLRVAAGFGLFAEEGDRRFGLTPMAQFLRTDLPDGQRDLILFNGDEMLCRPYDELLHTVLTGEPAFERSFGSSFFDYLEQHGDSAELFDRAMTQMSRATADFFLAQYDFSRFARIADLGGGRGHFLAEILRTNPGTKGVLFDLPTVAAEAVSLFEDRGLCSRVEVVPGDLFQVEDLPAGCDAYLFKAVLHDWSDAKALEILRNVRAAIGEGDARLLLCEFLLGPTNRWDRGKLLDLDMLLRFGGRERDPAEWHELLERAGFALANDPVPGRWAVMECVPR